MRFRRDTRYNRTVLTALAGVGDAGMTPLALAVTTGMPEARLQATLERLIDAGLVDRRVDPQAAVARLRRSRYHLASTRRPVEIRLAGTD